MVTIKSYIPILRWKKAERDALATLDTKVRGNITPLFELIMPAPKRDKGDYNKILSDSKTVLQNVLPSTVEELNKCCPMDSTAFVDVHLIDGDLRSMTLKQILNDSLKLFHATLIPVTHIIPVVSTDADTATRQVAVEYAANSSYGLCIRIDRHNLDNEDNLSQIINDFVTQNKLDISNTDLLIDLGIVDKGDDAKKVKDQLSRLPSINSWRTLILSGGAFPKDLSEFDKHSQNQIQRHDWRIWNDLREANPSRLPYYSDYAIQHPIFYGQIPGTNASASVRYTDDTQWEVSRGEGLRNKKGAGHKQYPALAQIIIGQNFFKGENFSAGDKYIAERAADNTKTGNPTTWLKAGLNHHLTLITKQLATSGESAKIDEQ